MMRRLFLCLALTVAVTIVPRAATSNLEGTYRVEGTNPDGKPYTALCEIRAQGSVFILHWTFPGSQEEAYGVGIVSHGLLVVAAGPPTQMGVMLSNVAVYTVKRGKPLTGTWSTPEGKGLYEEVLTKLPKDHPQGTPPVAPKPPAGTTTA